MYLHKEGKVAEYQDGVNGFFWLVGNPSGFPIYLSKEEIYQAAMDYHETEGCKVYLELYQAPEKGDYAFIAQDMDGEWCGFHEKPHIGNTTWDDGESPYDVIQKSPPNPFWRKTLR